jgi:uncharacterized membrane protein YeaQ/YmgE (transglycosylase-associated protein family)
MKVWISRIARSKTMIFSIMLGIIGAIQASTEFLSTLFSPQAFGFLTFAIGVIAAILRVLTTESLEDK